VLLAAASLLVLFAAFRRVQEARVTGEHGLLVYVRDDSVQVQWLTSAATTGRLEVVRANNGEVLARAETGRSILHRAAVPAPRAAEVILRYGGATDARYETRVLLDAPRRARVAHSAVDSLYIVGDTHGMYDELRTGLRNAGLIDSAGHWSGGRKQLVFAGDLMDRGPDVLQLLWFVYRLEREAAAAGGRVHVLLGNHEIMVMLGDLRYVHPKEAHVAALHGISYDRLFDIRTSVLGRWLASKPAVTRIGRVLITHGGVSDAQRALSLQQIDDTLRTYMGEELFYRWTDTTHVVNLDSASFKRRADFFFDTASVFWYRGYVQNDSLSAQLDDVLRRYDADVLVVGHTATPTATALYDGRVIAAHTRQYGGELVLLVGRGRGEYTRYRVGGENGAVVF
jgi:hypothetical protein